MGLSKPPDVSFRVGFWVLKYEIIFDCLLWGFLLYALIWTCHGAAPWSVTIQLFQLSFDNSFCAFFPCGWVSCLYLCCSHCITLVCFSCLAISFWAFYYPFPAEAAFIFYHYDIFSPWYLCHIGAEPTTNCNSNKTYAILFQIYPCITY